MGKLSKLFDKAGDMFMPKELAPFAGPLAMAFAGPLGMPLALGIGQLGSAKMHSGKLDPYTAIGTMLSAQGYKARNPQGYGKIGSGLKEGLGTFLPGGETPADFFTAYNRGYENPGYIKGLQSGLKDPDFDRYLSAGVTDDGEMIPIQREDILSSELLEETDPDKLLSPDKGFFESQGFLDEATQNIGQSIMPGFTNPETGKFDFMKALTTVGTVTTVSQLMPMAEELKKQKALDEKEEADIWKTWFEGYKRTSGRSYGDSPYPDPGIMEKWEKYGKGFGLAKGGRIGYNTGGITDIVPAAPGMPEGMQLDGRDGIFVSQGEEEQADDVAALLSKNEFVLTADSMKGFDKMTGGSGDPRAAAQKMYQFMEQMEAVA